MALIMGLLFCLCSPALMAADGGKKMIADLTAPQIIEKNVAARGGLEKLHALQTISLNGKLDAGTGSSTARAAKIAREAKTGVKVRRAGNPQDEDKSDATKQVQLPFTLEMKRPHMSRVEVEFAGKTSLQVYDGKNGWLVRPYLNRNSVEPFTAEQAKAQEHEQNIDAPLIDYAAKGTKVELAGVEQVEGRDAYNLKLTTKDGRVQHVWVDKQSFLDVKIEGTPRRMDGRLRTVWIYQRDFRDVNGLKIPFVLETAVDGFPGTHKMVLDKVAVNPKLDDALFAKPKA